MIGEVTNTELHKLAITLVPKGVMHVGRYRICYDYEFNKLLLNDIVDSKEYTLHKYYVDSNFMVIDEDPKLDEYFVVIMKPKTKTRQTEHSLQDIVDIINKYQQKLNMYRGTK